MHQPRISFFHSFLMTMLLAWGAVSTLSAQNLYPWMNTGLPPDERAALALKQMTLAEKIGLLHGNGMSMAAQWQMPLTYLSNGGAGYVKGVERLGIPALIVDDAAYGVRGSAESGRYATALPSTLGATSSWDTNVACNYGALIGRELRAQGFNMTLGGGVNLTREPRNGRTFEYAGEDPLFAGIFVGNLVRCEQDQHVVGDIKHYAVNSQETGRNIADAIISRRALQESDLLAFHIAIDVGNPAAVMCSFNKVNGDYACENPYLLTDVLKRDWGFKGFVVSDWGGTHSTAKASAAGLDQEEPMADFFGPALESAVTQDKVPMQQIDDHVRRVLYGEFLSGVVDHPLQKSSVDALGGAEIARRIEEKSIVLLRNQKSILPLNPARDHTIALIGAHADIAMLSGGGSAQVDPPGGNAILPPGEGATHWQDRIWFPTSPLKALRATLPGTLIRYNSGENPQVAAEFARSADVAVVFAWQSETEGIDLPSLALPDGQDGLIEAVAAANQHTIVVLESGTAVTMPWLAKVQGVVEAWYAGSGGDKALANVLTGKVNPSGKLTMTFPLSDRDLPHPTIASLSPEDEGAGSGAINDDRMHLQSRYPVNYEEGLEVGYKWYEAEHKPVLFPFGFGLSYTTYSYTDLRTEAGAGTVTFSVKNTGRRAGTEIAQVYASLPAAAGECFKRLAGWKVIDLMPGQTTTVTVTLDRRVLAIFNEGQNAWETLPGTYGIVVGASSADTPLEGTIKIQ